MSKELPSVSVLNEALADLDRERLLLDVGLLDRVPHYLRARTGELAKDVVEGLSHVLLPAAADLMEEQERVNEMIGTIVAPLFASLRPPSADVANVALRSAHPNELSTQPGAHARLRLAFKQMFFSLRSLQDALNTSCFFLVEGTFPTRKKASIQFALGHPESPVGSILANQVPGYDQWFTRWRDQRNRVKDGTGFGTFQLDGDIGIHFTSVTDDNVYVVDPSTSRVGLNDVAEALRETTRLIDAVLDQAHSLASLTRGD
jgi:hypothetical protein